MNIIEVYDRFPTEDDCLAYLEKVRWGGTPVCPYCGSRKSSPMQAEHRHHCNNCNTTYSVAVRTIFHHTRLPLQKWFLAITLVLNAKKGISARQLSRDLKVNKDTAWSMAMRIRRAMLSNRDLLRGIVEMDETYVGGKPRKGGPKSPRGRGTKKLPAVGMAERGGQVRAQPVNDTKHKTLRSLVRGNVDLVNTRLITDQFVAYDRMSDIVQHETVNHNETYADGDKYTSTIECFWALLKRGIVGQYHKVTAKYLPKYIDEFSYRFSNRNNGDMFDTTLHRAVGVV
jgi:transposase-like protein